MLNIVIELEKGNLNPLIESFKFNSQTYIISREEQGENTSRILQEIGRNQSPKVKLAASRGSRTSLYNIRDIYYIEAFRNLQRINGRQGNFEFYGTLGRVEEIMKPFGFLRIHHSYVISTEHIRSATSCAVTMTNGKEINVGRKYLADYRRTLRSLDLISLNERKR